MDQAPLMLVVMKLRRIFKDVLGVLIVIDNMWLVNVSTETTHSITTAIF